MTKPSPPRKLSAPRHQQSPDRVINDVQRALTAAIEALVQIPFLDGRAILGISLDTVNGLTQNIAHGLQRPFRGWFLMQSIYDGAKAPIYQEESPNPSLYLRLSCAENVAFSIWVF